MTILTARNDGGSRFTATFTNHGSTVVTDAAAGHGGEGSSYSPIDLTLAALVNCTGTLIAIKARSMGLDTTGMTLAGDYAMGQGMIGSCTIAVAVPCEADERQRQGMVRAAAHCPVRRSLHPDIKVELTIRWADGSVETVAD
ncbi:putative Predicted redox protein [uncultured Alphaproteobacteria bacterium]|uniref:Putative Predicted redox protein n=1 Tax=uncultured Alphaproteobacteria bacterium TaxID=91750 RepID=A0A212JLP8_9PROT|nr:putative Predicted redox protein [uncultured Alphaproteobacteria bacterium]